MNDFKRRLKKNFVFSRRRSTSRRRLSSNAGAENTDFPKFLPATNTYARFGVHFPGQRVSSKDRRSVRRIGHPTNGLRRNGMKTVSGSGQSEHVRYTTRTGRVRADVVDARPNNTMGDGRR